jgi:ATP-dependent Clp protease adaptor protein ClpS
MAQKPISALLASRTVSPATETPVREPRVGDPGGDLDAPWRVIVLNDDHNTFDGVAFALSSVLPGITFDRGMDLANRIHNTGRAVVWSGLKERAELYWEQLRDHGLTMAPLDRL